MYSFLRGLFIVMLSINLLVLILLSFYFILVFWLFGMWLPMAYALFAQVNFILIYIYLLCTIE